MLFAWERRYKTMHMNASVVCLKPQFIWRIKKNAHSWEINPSYINLCFTTLELPPFIQMYTCVDKRPQDPQYLYRSRQLQYDMNVCVFSVYIRIYFKYWWKLRCMPYINDLIVQVANLERKNVLTKYRSNVCARPALEGLNRNSSVDILRPRQNGRHIADDIFGRIFLDENVWISIKIPLKFVAKDPIKNMAALVQIMAWRRPGDKPLSEPMRVCLLTHICTTQPHFVNVQREHAMRKPASHISICALLHSSHLCS